MSPQGDIFIAQLRGSLVIEWDPLANQKAIRSDFVTALTQSRNKASKPMVKVE